ncbi:MAG TPA: 1-acyl-sn-glycerol-3-phosphate acyltransferase [Cyclobacteriaceae bacterium]|nr:1-acyl-sn-glycerol-3-phosphate acyltransferase [Cyclobacteriaceae bacterium]
MIDVRNFDEIRPFRDEEVNGVLMKLLENPSFRNLASLFYPEMPLEDIKKIFSGIRSLREFQEKVTYIVLKKILGKSSSEISCIGFEILEKGKAYLFISNHHDIVLDPSILNVLLFEKGFNTTKIAIGDNLLHNEWIRTVARLNKSFIVHRNTSFKHGYYISQRLSNFIRKSLLDDRESVWIAQREGRAKDGNDVTQVSLLKMLAYGGDEDSFEYLKSLNIIPVSISYEFDPCDILKVRELIEKEKNKHYRKSPEDDVISMSMGLRGNKGRIHATIGKIIDEEFDQIVQHESQRVQFQALAALIDEQIQTNIRLWPSNYIAYDLLLNRENHSDLYSGEDQDVFKSYIEKRLSDSHLDNPDARTKILSIYANPVKNKLRYTGF